MEEPLPAYKGEDPYVFVCYPHADKALVGPDIRWLQDQGINIWYDEGISAGTIWRAEIAEAIQSAAKFLYYISQASLQSPHCNREIDYAIEKDLDIVPIFLDETELTPALEIALHRVQALHRTRDSRYRQHLLNALGESKTIEDVPATRKQLPARRLAGLGLIITVLTIGGWWYAQRDLPSVELAEPPVGVQEDVRNLRSIAVLPFDNLAADPEQDYFVAGMHTALISELAQLGALTVISRTSVNALEADLSIPQIAEKLNVGVIVEGSVLQDGDRVRIQAQLFRTNPEASLWSETYDRDLHDVLTLHKEVTREIARKIELSLSDTESDRLELARDVDPQAHLLYLKGRHLMESAVSSQQLKSIELFQSAIAADPDSALAYVGLADAYTTLAGYGNASRRPILEKAQVAVEKALELEPMLGEAYATLGYIEASRWNWAAAERYYSRAISLSPSYAPTHWRRGLLLMFQGHFDRGITEARIAQQLDPLGKETNTEAGWILHQSRRYDDALVEFDRVLELHPGYTSANWMRGQTYIQMGRHEDALREFDQCSGCLSGFGIAYGAMGRTTDALKVIDDYLERIEAEPWLAGFIAIQYATIDDKDQALEWLNRAYESGDYWPETLRVEPLFDPLRGDPRFDDLVRRMNFLPND